LQIIFFIAILEGEPRRFEPRPHLEAIRQKNLKNFMPFLITFNGVVVMTLLTCAGIPGSNPCGGRKFYTCFNHLIIYEEV
jgi:hypothetical protein